MYQKILVPLDGSELAECALNHLKVLFKDGRFGEITLLNVLFIAIPLRGLYGDESGPPFEFDYDAFKKKYMENSKSYLATVQSRLASEGIRVKTETLESNRPSAAIADYAENNRMELIIMATHGYTGMKKMMLGSVALQVLHESNVPVLLVRPEACRV